MRTAIVWFLARVLTALYYVYQFIFPTSLKTWLSNVAPYSPDVYAPAGFLEPRPNDLPDISPVQSVEDDLTWKVGTGFWGWLNPLSLLAIRRNITVIGVVMLVEVRPANATWNHDTFYVAPADPSILNRFALKCLNGTYDNNGLAVLKCWVPVGTPLPVLSSRVSIEGTLCADMANRWIGVASCGKRWLYNPKIGGTA